ERVPVAGMDAEHQVHAATVEGRADLVAVTVLVVAMVFSRREHAPGDGLAGGAQVGRRETVPTVVAETDAGAALETVLHPGQPAFDPHGASGAARTMLQRLNALFDGDAVDAGRLREG